jgi:hypothetical protein
LHTLKENKIMNNKILVAPAGAVLTNGNTYAIEV